ncbi:MAG: chemotaxis protein CheB [Myxococcota bacterium]|nr:chemotaxis protein CheB [Myxococcota bacterium]
MSQITPSFRVAGIGASAGGLEALTELFAPIQPNGKLAFVVIQHLSPHFQSVMNELLTKKTRLRVVVAEQDMVVEPDTVYLNRPESDLEVKDGHLALTPWPKQQGQRGPHFPIDVLFRSLAAEHGVQAMGVVLSGTGSDGSRGLKAIHEAGGLTVVQRPGTAQFEGMPDAALRATICNLVLPPKEIGAALEEHIASPMSPDQSGWVGPSEDTQTSIRRLLTEAHGLQLDLYKEGTVGRRIERRADLMGLDSMEAYLAKLQEDPDELERLYYNLLIGVTRYFRDEEAFQALAENVALQLVRGRDEIRAWVPACATGEEAYSIAMVLHENADDTQDVKVFATDLHQQSIRIASTGFYAAEAVAGLSPERLQRYFVPVDGGYRVRKYLRDSVVFATHDLLRDPPFSRVDLVSCRNLLIYFNNAGQRLALSRLVFAMNPGGLLFLGPSESPGEFLRDLEPVDARWKLFRKVRASGNYAPSSVPRRVHTEHSPAGVSLPRVPQFKAYDALLKRYAPAGLLVDNRRQLLHVLGEGSRLLVARAGRPSLNVLELVPDGMRGPLGAGLFRTEEAGEPTRASFLLDGESMELRVEALELGGGETAFLVTFGEPPARESAASALVRVEEGHNYALEQELSWTRESLQAAMEEAESSNEELQAANEELVAANEELQSTNEELQSVNEELHTVNGEYREKNAELLSLTSDLENLVESISTAVVFLDGRLRIRRFIHGSGRVFNLLPGDEGRPLGDLCVTGVQKKALQLARQVAAEGKSQDRETVTPDGDTFLLQARPYRVAGELDGVVLSFVDLTALRDVQHQADIQRSALDSLALGVAIWKLEDPSDLGSFRLLYVNPASGKVSGIMNAQVVGKTAAEAFQPSLEQGLFGAFKEVLDTKAAQTTIFEYRDPRTSPRWLRRVLSPGPMGTVMVLFEDVTIERATQERQEAARRMHSVGEVAGSVAHDLNNLLGVILLTTNTLGQGEEDCEAEDIEAISQAANRAADLVAQLLSYSKRRPMSPKSVQLTRLLHRLRPILQTILGPNVHLTLELPPDLWWVRVDPTALEQTLVNLATNARNALGSEPGSVRLDCANIFRDDAPWRVQLVFSDDGPGMLPEVAERCFEPFFSTQPKGLGTGLGLASSRGFVQQSGGDMWVESELGQGAQFYVQLPAHQRDEEPLDLSDAEIGAERGRLLLVDDEPGILRATGRQLEAHGFSVFSFASGAEALEWVQENGAPDLLITDVLMPEMNGPTLVERLHQLQDAVPVLFMSGYADHAGIRNAAWELNAHNFLEKPFTGAQLITMVTEILERTKKG